MGDHDATDADADDQERENDDEHEEHPKLLVGELARPLLQRGGIGLELLLLILQATDPARRRSR